MRCPSFTLYFLLWATACSVAKSGGRSGAVCRFDLEASLVGGTVLPCFLVDSGVDGDAGGEHRRGWSASSGVGAFSSVLSVSSAFLMVIKETRCC